MLTSITPLGERGRGRDWRTTTAWYLAGSTIGGLGVGVVAGTIGSFFPTLDASVALIAAGVALVGTVALDRRATPIPGPRRQVNEEWLTRYRGWYCGFGFGLQLGAGVTTIVTTTTVYATLFVAALTQSSVAGALVGGAYGLMRALPIFLVRDVRTFRELTRVDAFVERIHGVVRRWSQRLTVAAGMTAISVGVYLL